VAIIEWGKGGKGRRVAIMAYKTLRGGEKLGGRIVMKVGLWNVRKSGDWWERLKNRLRRG
jgi:hypothetical protein